MKKTFSLSSLLMAGAVMITFLMSSCVPSYKKVIPASAVSVVEVDVKNLCKKSNFVKQQEDLADLIASIDLKDKTLKKISAFVEEPEKTGLNLAHPVYMFVMPTTDDMFLLASVKNQEDAVKTLEYFSDNLQVRTFDNISWLYINNTLSGVLTGKALLLGNVENKNIYRHLLEQDDHFFASKSGRWMKCHSGDITAMLNMENLSSKDRRNLECTLEKNLDMLSKAEVDDILEQVLTSKVAVNLEFKAGKLVLNTATKGLNHKSTKDCNKRVKVADLKKVPNDNLWAVAAIGLDGNACWDIFKKTMRPLIKEMSCQEREELEAIEDFVRAMDGTIVGAAGGKKIDQNPELLCILPTSVMEVESAIEDYEIEIADELQLDGNKKYSTITNKTCYNPEKVAYPFKKACRARMTYAYAYFNMEPAMKMLFDELACEADCHQAKVYDKLETLCNMLDYAEWKVPTKNKTSLSLYLNDKSENSLTYFLEHGIKIGNAIVNYNCNVNTSVPAVEITQTEKKVVDKNTYRRYIKSIGGNCEVCNYN